MIILQTEYNEGYVPNARKKSFYNIYNLLSYIKIIKHHYMQEKNQDENEARTHDFGCFMSSVLSTEPMRQI